MNNLHRLIKQKESLQKKIHHLEIQKRKLRTHNISLQEKLKNEKISSTEFHKLLNEMLKKRSYKQWMIYFDEYHNYYKKHLKICKEKIKKEKIKNKKIILGSITAIFLIFATIFFILNPQLTGLVIENTKNETITKIITNETITKIITNETIQKNITTKELKFNNSINITIEKNISSKKYGTLVNTTNNKNKTILIKNITKIPQNRTILKETQIDTTKSRIIINRPVKWIQKIKLSKSKNETLILPKSAKNISILTAGEIQKSLNELNAFNKIINSSTKEEIKTGILTGKVTAEVQKKKGILTIFWEWITKFTITGQVITKTKEIIIETDNEKIIDLGKITETEIAIEFYTAGPTSIETKTERGKKITISAADELNYTKVLAYVEINKKVTNDSIYLYNLANNTKTLIDFTAQDLDSDGFVDYIEWIVPHLSEQTYELIFITKANHLDENKTIISDIYDKVKSKNNIWSETISENEFVRVVFEKALDNTKDITVYPRIISGNPSIEIYEVGKTEIIATFETIKSNQYNQVFLTNLIGSQTTFELKIINGSIEFDLIFDPTCTGTLNCQVYATENECNINGQCNWDPQASDVKSGTWTDTLGTFDATPPKDIWAKIPFNNQLSSNQIYTQNINYTTVSASSSGHYLVLYSIHLTSDYNNRMGWETRVAVNNAGIDGTYASGYIRNIGNDDAIMTGGGIINLAANDEISIELVYRTDLGDQIATPVSGESSFQVIKLDDSWNYASYAKNTNQIISSNVGSVNWVPLTWEITNEEDTGFIHPYNLDNSKIQLTQGGHYLLIVGASAGDTTRVTFETKTFVNDIEIPYGKSYSYNRGLNEHQEANPWFMIILNVAPNDNIQIQMGLTEIETAQSGNTIEENMGIFLIKLDDNANYYRSYSTIPRDPSGNTATPIKIGMNDVEDESDPAFIGSTSGDISIQSGFEGEYLFTFSGIGTRSGTSGVRSIPFMEWRKDNASMGLGGLGWYWRGAQGTVDSFQGGSSGAIFAKNSGTSTYSLWGSGLGEFSGQDLLNANQYSLTAVRLSDILFSPGNCINVGDCSSCSLNECDTSCSAAGCYITADILPQFSNFTENPSSPTIYSPSTNYEFNATVLQTNGTVYINLDNFNHTTISSGDIFTKIFGSLNANTHNYSWISFGNDTLEISGESVTQTYTIKKAASSISLKINNSESGITIGKGDVLNLSCIKLVGDQTSFITLFRNNSLIASSNNIESIELFNDTGDINITCIYPESQNYTSNTKTYFVNVARITPTHDIPILQSSLNLNTTIENITCLNQSTIGYENSLVKNIFNWKRNGNSIAVVNTPFEDGSNLLESPEYSGGLGYNLTVIGAVWNSSSGYNGLGAYEFNGLDNRIYLDNPSSSSIIFDATINSRTVILRYKTTKAPSSTYQVLFEEGGSVNGMNIYIYNGKIYMGAWSEGTSWIGNWTIFNTTSNNWHFAALIFDGSNSRIGGYHDGNLTWITGLPVSSVAGHTGDDHLAYTESTVAYPNSASDIPAGAYFQGFLDEFLTFDEAIPKGQLDSIYKNGFNQLDSNQTKIGENWTCEVTPVDEFSTGQTKESSLMTILEFIKLSSSISLRLNDSESNISLNQGDSTILACSKLTGDSFGIIRLFVEGIKINEGISTIQNLTTFSFSGLKNITCIYPETTNYYNTTKTFWVNVSINQAPFTPTPTLRSLSGKNESSDSLYCEDVVSDPEENDVNITLNWYKNDSLVQTNQYINYPSNSSFQSIMDSKNVSNGDIWKCELQLMDLFSSSPKINSSILVISNPISIPIPGSCSNFWGFDCATGPPETGGDNTFDTCANGLGTDESIEEIYLNETVIEIGKSLNVICNIDPYTSNDDTFIWYYNGTGWRKIFENINWGASIITNETISFIPDPIVGTHWIRCGIIYITGSDTDECMDTGSYYDNDDISFNVTLPPNNPPIISSIDSISPQTITESSSTHITFSFQVEDLDGTSDINDSSAYAEFQKIGEATRFTSCSKVGNINSTVSNYTCAIDIWYFDGAGDWTIKVSIEDTEDYAEDLSTTFLLGSTTAMTFAPLSLTFSGVTSPTNINTLADQNILINNTGNYEIPFNGIKIIATNLLGETNNKLAIYAENFTVHTANTCDIGTQIQNATSISIPGATLSKGNFSLDDGTGQEQLFYCIEAINSDLTAQTYSTNEYGAWTITLLLVALRASSSKKKKSKKKSDLLLERIKLLKNPEFLEFLENKNIFEQFKRKEIKIPVTIFKSRNALESICRYLKDEKEMKLSEISHALNRNPRTIWTSYHNSNAEIFPTKETNITIPISVFKKKSLSILESLSIYLKKSGMKNKDIAKILGKNSKTIWTFISRAEKKLK